MLKSDWLIPVESRNPISWILRCLKPHWVIFSCLKTYCERFFTTLKSDWLIAMEPRNLLGWTSKLLKPHWMKSAYPITYGPTMFKTSYSLVIDFTKTDVLLTPVQTHTQTIFFHMTLPTVEGNYYLICSITVALNQMYHKMQFEKLYNLLTKIHLNCILLLSKVATTGLTNFYYGESVIFLHGREFILLILSFYHLIYFPERNIAQDAAWKALQSVK